MVSAQSYDLVDFDVEIDDPNFWELWARRLKMDPNMLAHTGVSANEPRMRRQLRRLKGEDLSVPDFDQIALPEPGSLPTPPPSADSGALLWTHEERMLFGKLLLRFGPCRFTEISRWLPHRSRADLVAASRAVIKYCIENHGVRDDTRFREDQEKLLLAILEQERANITQSEMIDAATGKFDLAAAEEQLAGGQAEELKLGKADIPYAGAGRRHCLEYRSLLRQADSEGFADALMVSAKTILLRLHLLELLRQSLEESVGGNLSEATKPSDLLVASIPGAPPAPWWSEIHDQSLLLLIHQLGYPDYEAVRKAGIFAETHYADAPELTDEPGEEEKADGYVSEEDEEKPAKPSNLKAAMEESGVPTWPHEGNLEARLRKLVTAMQKRSQAAAKMAAHTMQSGIVGGLGARRSRRQGDEAVAMEDADGDDEVFVENRSSRRRSAAPDSFSTPRGRGGARRQSRSVGSGGAARMSKRDRSEFHRLITLHGVPALGEIGQRDWSRFIEMGVFGPAVHRNPNALLDAYLDTFKQACDHSLKKALGSKGKRKLVPAADDDEEEEEPSSGEDEEEDEEAALPHIPADRAKKALGRIEWFELLRSQVLARPNLHELVLKARRTAGLPRWWDPAVHDVALLQAVARYGLGHPQLLVADPDFAFFDIYAAADPAFAARQQEAASKNVEPQAEGEEDSPASRRGRPRGKPARKAQSAAPKNLPYAEGLDLSLIQFPNEMVLTRRIESLVDNIMKMEEVPVVTESQPKTPSSPRKRAAGKAAPTSSAKRQRTLNFTIRKPEQGETDEAESGPAEGVQEQELGEMQE